MFEFLINRTDNRIRSAARIAYLEQKYGITFPEILRELYASTDSPEIKLCEFEIGGRSFAADQLVLLQSDDGDIDFEYAADNDRDEPMCSFVPPDWYPLLYCGNFFYWSSISHKVYYLDHEDVDNPVLIAESIEEFIEMLDRSAADES